MSEDIKITNLRGHKVDISIRTTDGKATVFLWVSGTGFVYLPERYDDHMSYAREDLLETN